MGRILAIDYGRKRVGLAVTDPLKIIANRLTTVRTHELMDFLTNYFLKESIDLVVVGYPKTLRDEPSESVQYLNPFLKQFGKRFPQMRVELVDERFTSKLAFQAMIDAGVKKKDRQDKALIDGVSATIILQFYLETQRNLN
jgi:putative holliday junction resolvase